MDDTIYRFVVLPITLTSVLAAYVNLRQYNRTTEWLRTHQIDFSFYEEKLGCVNYYIGWLGRHLAYRIHSR